jgi:MFS superfamily sulfate permease-like transporter
MARRRLPTPILADLVGGVSLTGLMVPEAIAYSSIAGLPASFGITAAVVGPIAYAIVGRSRLAVVTATSGAAALLAAAIANSALPNVPRADCAVALTALVGLFFLIGAALRVGPLTSFISRAVLQGFGLGLAITIAIRQLPKLLGLPGGAGSPWRILEFVAAHAGSIHVPSLALGCAVLLLLVAFRRVRFAAGGLVVIIAAIVAMRFAPAGHFGVATAGSIALQLEAPHLPDIRAAEWARLAQFAVPVAIVLLAESWATVRTLAVARGDDVSAEREIAALGMANLASALLRGLPVGAGFSISNANAQSATATRLGAVLAAIAVAIAVSMVPQWISLIPEPLLAAIVISALSHALSIKPIQALFRVGKDQWIAVAAAVGVLLFGIINGLLLAVGLSVLGLLRRLANPRLSELGRTGAHDFVDCAMHPQAQPVAGMLIIRPNAPLFFGNADAVLEEVAVRARAADAGTVVLSLEESDDLDSTALGALSDFCESMANQSRSVFLARVHDRVRAILERGGLASMAERSTFSVDDAVRMAAGDQSA